MLTDPADRPYLYVPVWAQPAQFAWRGPTKSLLSLVVTDIDGASSVAASTVVTVAWPPLSLLFVVIPTVMHGNGSTAQVKKRSSSLCATCTSCLVSQSWLCCGCGQVRIGFNDTNSNLVPLLWLFNSTSWIVTAADGRRVPHTCGNSSTCWLTGLDSAGTYRVSVSVGLMEDVAAPTPSFSCATCRYSLSGVLKLKKKTLHYPPVRL